VRVIALFMFVWPYVHSHILYTQLVICLLSHFIHIWYLGWPWAEHAHIIPISRMVDFCERININVALFMFVWPYVRSHILCTQLVICLLSHFIHIWYLDWSWSEHAHIIQISRMVDFCESYSPFHVCLSPDLVQAFLKKWWVESDFKVPNLLLSLRLTGSGCHYNSIYNNTGTK
jgi:hypothetical protein